MQGALHEPAGMPRGLMDLLRSEPAVVGLDVDGTLLDNRMRMSPAIGDVLARLSRSQHHTVIATGRGLSKTLPVVRAAQVADGYAVAANGAITARIQGGDAEIIDTRTFDPDEALRRMREVVPEGRYAVETAAGDFFATESFEDAEFGIHAEVVSFEELCDHEDVIRVVVTKPDMPREEFRRIVQKAGLHGVEYAVGYSSWLDMSAPGVTKATALARTIDLLGARNVLAIGDGSNDIDMLRWANLGVAMGQANRNVKDAADAVTGPIEEDGAAAVLNELLAGTEFAQDPSAGSVGEWVHVG